MTTYLENFVNFPSITTLNGAINDSVTSITLTAVPTDLTYTRIRIDDELMFVTNVASLVLTVVRGIESTTPASHSNGATVSPVLTAGGLEQRVEEGSLDIQTSTATSLTLDDTYFTVLMNNSSDSVVTLPSAATMPGRSYTVRKIYSGTAIVTLTPDGSETIDGAATLVLYVQNDFVKIQSDGTNWFVIVDGVQAHRARIYRVAALNAANGENTTVAFDTVGYDNASIATIGSSLITIKRSGVYHLKASAAISGLDDGEIIISRIMVNGTSINAAQTMSPGTDKFATSFVSTVRDLSAGDVVTMNFYNGEGVAQAYSLSAGYPPELVVTEQRGSGYSGGSKINAYTFTTQTASSYTAASGDYVLCDLTSNSITVDLPTSPLVNDRIGVKLITGSGTNIVTIDPYSTQEIDGFTTVVLYIENDFIEIMWDGTSWRVVSDGIQPHLAKMYTSADLSILHNTITLFNANVTDYDGASLVDLSTDRITVRRGGVYTVDFGGIYLGGALDAGERLLLAIYVNGTKVQTYTVGAAITNQSLGFGAFWTGSLNAGDYVEGYITQYEGSTQSISASSGDVRPYLAVSEMRGGGYAGGTNNKMFSFTTQTASTYSAVNGDYVLCDLTSNSITVDLPQSPSENDRIGVKLKTASGSNTVTIDPYSTGTIDGSTTITLYVANDFLEIMWDGSEWKVVSDGIQPHIASVARAAAQSIPDITITQVNFDTSVYDNAGLADVTTNYRIDIRRSGLYLITASSTSDGVIDDNEMWNPFIYINGTLTFTNNFMSTGTNGRAGGTLSGLFSLSAGDYVDMRIYQSEGAAQDTVTDEKYRTRLAVMEQRGGGYSGGTRLEAFNFTTQTSSTYSAVNGDYVLCDLTSNSITINLPQTPATNDRIGAKIVTASGTNTVTLDPYSTQEIDGQTTIVLYVENDFIEIMWDGSEWRVVSDGIQAHVARMSNSISQSCTSGIVTTLQFDTEDYDNAGLADISTETVTIRRSGLYTLNAFAYSAGNLDAGERLVIAFYVNGSTYVASSNISAGATNTSVSYDINYTNRFSAGDTIVVTVVQYEGSTQSISSGTFSITEQRGGGHGSFYESLSPPYGLTHSVNVTDANNDTDITAGWWPSDETTVRQRKMLTLTSAITKRLDASWAVGTNQGGLDTGSKANSTWYATWLIMRTDTGVVDVLYSTSFTSPTMPANYDRKAHIGQVLTDGSGNILAYTHYLDDWDWDTQIQNLSITGTGSNSSVRLSTPPYVCDARVNCFVKNSSVGSRLAIQNGTNSAERGRTIVTSTSYSNSSLAIVRTSSTGYMNYLATSGGSWTDCRALTSGYNDFKGRQSNGAHGSSGAIPLSEVWVTTGNGYGSTATKIRRYSVAQINTGDAITYADSAANGSSFTINENGLYSIGRFDYSSVGASLGGVSVNSGSLTTDYYSLSMSERTPCEYANVSTTGIVPCSAVIRLSAGDVVRPHDDATLNNGTNTLKWFHIIRIGN